MKFSVVIFIALLAIGAFANRVKVQSRTGSEGLLEFFQEMYEKTVEEQNAHTTLAEEQDAQCESEINFRIGEVSDANGSLIASDSHLKKCQGALDQANSDLANLAAQLEVVTSLKASLEDARSKALALFQGHEQEHLDAITAVDEAFDILGQFENSNAAGASLLAQLGKHINKQIKVSIGSKFFMHLAPVIAFLASTPKDVTVSAEDLAKLTELFQKLKGTLQSSLSALRDAEAADVEAFNIQDALYQSQIDIINQATANFADYVIHMKDCISTETEVSSEASSKLSRNSQVLVNTEEMCAAFDKEYADATAARTQKLKNIELLVSLLESTVTAYQAGAYYHPSD